MAFDDNKYKLKNILMEEIAKDSEKQKMLKITSKIQKQIQR